MSTVTGKKKTTAINQHFASRIGRSMSMILMEDVDVFKAGDKLRGKVLRTLPKAPELVACANNAGWCALGYLGIKSKGSLFLIERRRFLDIDRRKWKVIGNFRKVEDPPDDGDTSQ